MKILYFAHSVLNRGGDRVILAYLGHLAEAGHEVVIRANDVSTVFAIPAGIRIEKPVLPTKLGTIASAFFEKQNADCVLATIIHMAVPLMARNKSKLVYYAQADDREYYDGKILRNFVHILYKCYFSLAMPVISMSQHLSNILTRGYSIVRLSTIETGIDQKTFYREPDDGLLKSKGGRRAMVFMARGDHFRKGYDLALKVFLNLGRGPLRDKLELWVCGNRLEGDFGFAARNFGPVTDSRLRQILSSADIFFYPSRHEGFGLFPLEAMICGSVPVTTNAIPYAATTPGVLCSRIEDTADMCGNITKLVDEPEFLEVQRTRAMKAAREYDMEKSKIDFSSALMNIVSGKT
jgi:glycosyltransferase involved in cell wall biosynthesis